MFLGRKASRTNIHFLPDRCAFAPGLWVQFRGMEADRKRIKRKESWCWNISALSCACSSSQQQLPLTHILSFPETPEVRLGLFFRRWPPQEREV
ncbi:hypothetical protein CEXT_523181 [Caerostris extrusa]|uniref:Uncharacterized protein n=1 Tax=Caerostris extrusa TaxID=172846 RepID=A0AAV4SGK5_CAEEX|nr:hypothetical protein CEXT_523181 [Caerostris extrusa]